MKFDSIKRFALDFLYGTAALVALNGVITFLVYPFINRTLGNEANGQVLFFTAIMGLMAPEHIGEEWLRPIGRRLVLSPEIIGVTAPETLDGFVELLLE